MDISLDIRQRCPWGLQKDMGAYHDSEWGVPVHDDARHFEFIVLEGAQAGLSWRSVLIRREGYRQAFAGFDAAAVAGYTNDRMAALLTDPGIIRNRAKVESAVNNAKRFLSLQEEFGSFDSYIWNFVEGAPVVNHWTSQDDVPAAPPLAETVSRDMRQRGFTFFGPTICYSHLQACGLVNDHLVTCYRHRDLDPAA